MCLYAEKNMKLQYRHSLLKYAAVAGLTLAGFSLQACTPTHHVRGNFLKDYQIAEITAGEDNVSDVIRKLGSPTAQSTFDPTLWYYIGQETEKRGVFDAEVKEEQVVVLKFNQQGVVEYIQIADAERNDLPYVAEKTPTSGNEVTIMQQLVGNIGKFNSAGGGPSPTGDR